MRKTVRECKSNPVSHYQFHVCRCSYTKTFFFLTMLTFFQEEIVGRCYVNSKNSWTRKFKKIFGLLSLQIGDKWIMEKLVLLQILGYYSVHVCWFCLIKLVYMLLGHPNLFFRVAPFYLIYYSE